MLRVVVVGGVVDVAVMEKMVLVRRKTNLQCIETPGSSAGDWKSRTTTTGIAAIQRRPLRLLLAV